METLFESETNTLSFRNFKNYKQDTLIIRLKSNKGGLEKKDLAFLDLLQANNWERPIYFNNTSLNGINLDIKRNVVQEGFAYRLLPILNPSSGSLVNTDMMFNNLMKNSYWRELDNENAYFSEDHRGFIMNYRATFNTLIKNLIQKPNKKNKKASIIIITHNSKDKALNKIIKQTQKNDPKKSISDLKYLELTDSYIKQGKMTEQLGLELIICNFAAKTAQRNS